MRRDAQGRRIIQHTRRVLLERHALSLEEVRTPEVEVVGGGDERARTLACTPGVIFQDASLQLWEVRQARDGRVALRNLRSRATVSYTQADLLNGLVCAPRVLYVPQTGVHPVTPVPGVIYQEVSSGRAIVADGRRWYDVASGTVVSADLLPRVVQRLEPLVQVRARLAAALDGAPGGAPEERDGARAPHEGAHSAHPTTGRDERP
jgi:hypothetical protein